MCIWHVSLFYQIQKNMKRGFTQFSLMLVASITLFSCSVEKRYHSSGWNISLRKGGSDVAVAPVKKQKITVAKKNEVAKEDAAVAANVETPAVANTEFSMAKNVETPAVVVSTEKSNAVQAAVAVQKDENMKVSASAENKVLAEKNVAKATVSKSQKQEGSKSWLVALLLCFFLGGIGIHRFYLGYTWQGVVQLLTFGGFGIWYIIDFVRIIIRDLQPKDGSYED
jgi:hypothetical protein